MNTQTVLNVVTSPLAKEAGRTFVTTTAATAGLLTGLAVYSTASDKVKAFRTNRTARNHLSNES